MLSFKIENSESQGVFTKDANRLIRKQNLVHIAILLAVALGIGVYLISTAVVIAKDGVTFIEYAKNLTISGISTMRSQEQHPGYPSLIAGVHKVTRGLHKGMSIWGWIYCAQSTALIFRLLAIVILYFLAKDLVGSRFGFWSILILIFLPKPAEYGSDALSDWPYIFFLATGFFMLVRGAKHAKWWLYGCVGLVAGLGYLIRPECIQLVVLGTLWLALQLFWSKRTISRLKAASALALLLVGFFIIAGPYMKLKGAAFPKKHIGRVASNLRSDSDNTHEIQTRSNNVCAAGFAPADIIRGFGELVENVGEILMWFFLPALLMGLQKYFRRRNWCEPERFFIATFIALNIAVMIWLYCAYGYMSKRHTLPLVIFTIHCVPLGLRMLASLPMGKFSKKDKQSPTTTADKQSWFLVLTLLGICVCTPKLLRPLHYDKKAYKMAAAWLTKYTDKEDVISVADPRICFYAERTGVKSIGNYFRDDVKYVVQIVKEWNDLDDKIAYCDINIVNHPPEKRVIKELFLRHFKKRNPQIVTLKFPVPAGKPPCEFRVYLFAGNDLTLEAIDLQPTDSHESAQLNKEFGISSGKYPMITRIGIVDAVGRLIRGTEEGFLAYGPYIPLKEGNYTVKFQLKLNNCKYRKKVPMGMAKVWSLYLNKEKKEIVIYKRK